MLYHLYMFVPKLKSQPIVCGFVEHFNFEAEMLIKTMSPKTTSAKTKSKRSKTRTRYLETETKTSKKWS